MNEKLNFIIRKTCRSLLGTQGSLKAVYFQFHCGGKWVSGKVTVWLGRPANWTTLVSGDAIYIYLSADLFVASILRS